MFGKKTKAHNTITIQITTKIKIESKNMKKLIQNLYHYRYSHLIERLSIVLQ